MVMFPKLKQVTGTSEHCSHLFANNRVVFNIKGNQYRLIVAVKYEYGIIYIRFVGTHQAYDKVDATII